jgi:hypothetical protein
VCSIDKPQKGSWCNVAAEAIRQVLPTSDVGFHMHCSSIGADNSKDVFITAAMTHALQEEIVASCHSSNRPTDEMGQLLTSSRGVLVVQEGVFPAAQINLLGSDSSLAVMDLLVIVCAAERGRVSLRDCCAVGAMHNACTF